MKLLHLHALPADMQLPPTAITIGNFDGVHLGHQAMLHTLKQRASQDGLKTLVMLFEPQPLEFFKGSEAPPRITSLREKIELLKAQSIDYVLIAPFDHGLRSLNARQFADLLKLQLNGKALVLGDDFRFGCDRAGDSQFLRNYGFPIDNLETVLVDGERASSTRIRNCLMQGDFAAAARLLGRPYSITGRVQYGDQIGRTIDFPTINVRLSRLTPCLHGIYAVDVQTRCAPSLVGHVRRQSTQTGIAGYLPGSLLGAAHVGTRPAIAQAKPEWRLEVHFPEASANLYGLLVKVTFLHYVHGEKNYPSLDALKLGILDDVQQIRAFRQNTAASDLNFLEI
ncbi:riboflavin biosynthesis protein RibF [Alkanindiges sp. WGS2144]|uniref:riboflavin biosynthesis protein RibF n=1 Tax=Alkanindiges sp. WGS2144 TaxID=3366808 RepID=UPI0037538EC0